MSYIDSNLLPGEIIKFRTNKHWIVFLYPVVWVVFAIIATIYMGSHAMLERLVWAPWLVAVIIWGYVGLDYYTSEFAVTDKRVMMREGFFVRHSNETRLNAISQVNVDQSLIGRWLNYGQITINAFGAFDDFSAIASPFVFQQMVNEQMDKTLTR